MRLPQEVIAHPFRHAAAPAIKSRKRVDRFPQARPAPVTTNRSLTSNSTESNRLGGVAPLVVWRMAPRHALRAASWADHGALTGQPTEVFLKSQTGGDSGKDKELIVQQDLHISFRNMDVSEALEQRIRTRVAELERLCDRITSCSVVVEKDHRQPQQGKLFHVRVDLTVPGRTIVVKREPSSPHAHEDAHVAVRDAFDTARRQLEDHVRMARGDVKAHAKQV